MKAKPVKHEPFVNKILILVGAVLATTFVDHTARSESYGIKFLGAATTDVVTNEAGVVPISGWNNINDGSLATGIPGSFPITSSDGSLSATLTVGGYANSQTWYSASAAAGGPDGGNGSLLDGYIDCGKTGASPANAPNYAAIATIKGLTNASYNIYIYSAGDLERPTNDQAVTFIEGLPSFEVNGITYYTATLSGAGPFTGFVQGQTTNVNLSVVLNTNGLPGVPGAEFPMPFGNYIVISNVYADAGAITVTANADITSWRSPFDAVELVSSTALVPPALVTQTSSLTNYAGTTIQLTAGATGTPLNFQWMAGTIGSGVYTNVIDGGNVSGATNYVLTISNAVPSDAADYIVVITNSLGSVTSSVPTTVNLISLAINSVTPAAEVLYPGGRATFNVSAVGAPPITYQWEKVVGTTTNEIADATNSTLTINDVSAGDAASYVVVVMTPYATETGGPVSLALTTAPTDAYGQDIMSLGPVAYWRLSEGSGTNAYDYAGGHTAIYGPDAYLQDPGPSGPGFPANNTSLSPENDDQSGNSSYATLSASDGLNLNTNTVTIVSWVNPIALIPNSGIVYQRDSSGTAGLGLTGNGDLGYNWNNDANTYNWDSGLVLPTDNQWSLVVLTVTSTNATIYMYNASQQSSAVNVYPNGVTPFSGLLEIGSDPQNNESRAFSGDIGEVAVYNHALSSAEIVNLYTIGAGTPVAPGISTQPQSQWVLPGSNVKFTVFATGSDPISYQWQKNTDSGPVNITGATNGTLIISNVGPANVAGYSVEVVNPVTTVNSSVATLTLLPAPTGFETNVLNLDPLGYWPLNEVSGTNAFDYSGDGFHGAYEPGVTLDNTGPNPPFTGIDTADNVAPLFNGAANSYVSLPSLNLTSANVTITAWICPSVTQQNADAGIVFNRVNSANGLCYADDGTNLNYGWNNDGGLWHYSSGLVPPANIWSFVALVVTPTNATFYLYNTNSQLTDVNIHGQSPATFSGETRIADDNQGTREFQGKIAQVAIYDNSLSSAQVGKLYTSVGGILPIVPSDANLTIAKQSGRGLQLNWSQGTLLEATNVTGPWVTNTAAAPYTIPTTAPRMFYRIRLQ